MVDLTSIPFVKSFGLSPYIKYQHVIPEPKGIGSTSPKTYGLFHLNASIDNRFYRSFNSYDLFLGYGSRSSKYDDSFEI